ncbi:MAG: hypothetical protein ACRBBJ_05645 [Rhodomicrobiaceae bacterium]
MSALSNNADAAAVYDGKLKHKKVMTKIMAWINYNSGHISIRK